MTLTLCRIQLWADWVINSENLCLLVQPHLLQCRLLSLSLTIKDDLPHGSWSRRHLVSDLLCETKANLNRFVALWPDALLINSGKWFLTTWSLSIVTILSHLLLDAYIYVWRGACFEKVWKHKSEKESSVMTDGIRHAGNATSNRFRLGIFSQGCCCVSGLLH